MEFSELQLAKDERGVLVGATGTGKTTLAKAVISPFKNVLIMDPKASLKLTEYKRYTTIKALVKANDRKAIYAPNFDELKDPEAIDAFYALAYQRGETFVYTDEVYAVAFGDELPRHYHAIMTRGRERNVGSLNATQRPLKIPQVILSECEMFYIFKLRLRQDQERIERTIPDITTEQILRLPKRHFYVRSWERDNLPFQPIKLEVRRVNQNGESHAFPLGN